MRARTCQGYTYIGLLLLVAMLGIGLAVVSEVWQTAQKRDREEELLFVGAQMRHAIALYLASGSGYPATLEDLVTDRRFPEARRHLRRIYRDPFTGRAQWGLVKPDGKYITGVYSLHEGEPFRQTGFRLADQAFEGKKKYSDWIFSPSPSQRTSGAAQAGAAPFQSGIAESDGPR
jgi:type II secretory pathway pseudopilin PulG